MSSHRRDRNDPVPSPGTADVGLSPVTVEGSTDVWKQSAAEARRRWRAHLSTAFSDSGFADADDLAELALDALTGWRYADTGERCRCGCHPQLPISDRHDYGFDCLCSKTREERKRIYAGFRLDSEMFWQSPQGRAITAARRADDADLERWLATQPDVSAHADGPFAPEVWRGEVAGHRFYFRERGGQWGIELDPRPSGRFVQTVVGVSADGEPRLEPRETEAGEIIADGDDDEKGYGSTPCERVQFIVSKIRRHLSRAECTLHTADVSAIEDVVGVTIWWCPVCGAELDR